MPPFPAKPPEAAWQLWIGLPFLSQLSGYQMFPLLWAVFLSTPDVSCSQCRGSPRVFSSLFCVVSILKVWEFQASLCSSDTVLNTQPPSLGSCVPCSCWVYFCFLHQQKLAKAQEEASAMVSFDDAILFVAVLQPCTASFFWITTLRGALQMEQASGGGKPQRPSQILVGVFNKYALCASPCLRECRRTAASLSTVTAVKQTNN